MGEKEEIIKAILNASLESTLLIDLEGTIIAINETCAHRFGKTVSELLGSCLYDLFSPEIARSRKERIEESIRTRKQIRFQDTRNRRVFNNSVFPIPDAQGKTCFVTIYARDISEQRKSEEALRKSEEKFRNLAELLPQAVFEIDLSGNLTFCNAIGLEFFRYTQEDFEKGLNVLNMFVLEERSRLQENIQRKLAGEKLGEEGRHYIAIRKDGTKFPALVYTSPISLSPNEVAGLRGILIDDTERREAEDAVRALAKFQEAILRTSFDAFSVVDFMGNILFVDETMIDLSGYSEEEMLDQNFHISNITVGTEFAAHLIESARQKQRIIGLETSLIPKNTAPIPVELSSGLIEEEEERVLLSFRDLRTEKELSEEINLFRRFTYDFTYASLFKMTLKGPEAVITEPLPFATEDETDVLINMAIYYTTALGQGMEHSTGLYGPLPVPKASNLVSLVYSFSINDPTYTDPRTKGKTFAFVVLSIPESLIQLFANRAAIQKIFEEEIEKASVIQEIDLEFLKKLKRRILLQ